MTTPVYNLFISYNSRDHEQVSRLRDELTELGCESVFLDRLHLQPGLNWVDDLEAALLSSRSMAVFLGDRDMGRWQLRERAWALDQTTLQNSYKVIPVLLPGAKPPLGFLQQQMWIDLRQSENPRLLLPDRERKQQLKRLVEAIRGQEVPEKRESSRYQSPYRGLQAFREEDAGLFFGRDAAIRDLQELVRQQRLIAVTGASGCGKSSVVCAGLLPKLRKVTRGREVWDIVTMFPRTDPFKSLAEEFQPLIQPPTVVDLQLQTQINDCHANLLQKKLFLEDLVKVRAGEAAWHHAITAGDRPVGRVVHTVHGRRSAGTVHRGSVKDRSCSAYSDHSDLHHSLGLLWSDLQQPTTAGRHRQVASGSGADES
jgi:energy-coupling factor transporter ATP-binding protein EcfA2